MNDLLALTVGLLLGVVAGVALLVRSATVRAHGLFHTWRAEEARQLTRAAVNGGRLAGKASASADLAIDLGLPFLASDAHFVGDPVHLVVFDGDSEVKAEVIEDLRGIVLVSVLTDEALAGQARAELVAECVADGRVRWETVRYDRAPGTPD